MGHSPVGVDVLDDDRLTVLHCPPADACIKREAPSLPQRSDGVLVGVVAVVAFAEHECGSVGRGEPAGRGLHEGLDVGKSIGGHADAP